MSTQPTTPSLRDSVDELGERLSRIGAAASTLRNLSTQIRHGVPPSTLLSVIEVLKRDLTLASHQLDVVHGRTVLELSSVPDDPRTQ
jgi:hypothetical protein